MKEGNVLVQCRFDLTDSEIATAARKRGALETEIAKVESAFNVEREKHKKALGTLEGQAGALAELIRKGYELRETECLIEFDYDAGEVRTIREDTGEVVKVREMTESEKGKGMPLPLGPSILLGENDPDVVAAKTAETTTDTPADDGEAGATEAADSPEAPEAHEPDAREPGFQTPAARPYPSPEDVCLCGDLRSQHSDATGCDVCDCTEFRDADPLGLVGYPREEASDATR